MVGFAQMVILLSFLSSTEQQQNNVITVAVLAKVLTSFHSEKVVETSLLHRFISRTCVLAFGPSYNTDPEGL